MSFITLERLTKAADSARDRGVPVEEIREVMALHGVEKLSETPLQELIPLLIALQRVGRTPRGQTAPRRKIN